MGAVMDCETNGCACRCHAVSALEALRLAGIDATDCTERERQVLFALLPIGTRKRPEDVAELLFGDHGEPTHSLRVNLSRLRPKVEGTVAVNTVNGAIWLARRGAHRRPNTGGHWNRLYGPAEVERIAALRKQGLTILAISEVTGISKGTVATIVRGDHWTRRDGVTA
jgi:hypothetical protein